MNYLSTKSCVEDHGRSVVTEPASTSASSSSRASVSANIEIVNAEGQVDVTCDARGYVRKNGMLQEIGKDNEQMRSL